MSHDQEYLREFVVETREGLDRIDNLLLALEAAPGDTKELDAVFRTLHTLKGNAGFLNLPKLAELAHAGETLLSKLSGGKLTFNADIADVLLRLIDALRSILAVVESTGSEGTSDHDALQQELNQWTAAAQGAPAIPVIPRRQPPPAASPITSPPRRGDAPPIPVELPHSESTIHQVPAAPQQPTRAAVLTTPKADLPKSPEPLASNNSARLDSDWSVSAIGSKADPLESSTFIRVQIDQLDDLMNLVGELVLARNRIVQIAATRPDDEMTEPIQRLHRLTSSLQDGVMRTRMQPVRNAWRKYPRIVRDLAKQCGKECDVTLQGGDTELDKSMLEAIADPLVHLVRNAVDHGIEKPYLRKIKGKPETGRLLVRAFQESGQVHIEVSDDGAGIDLERIRQKAVEVGLISADKAQLMSVSDLQNSVFLPGFTTADRVTNLSGRGVGMDVVKTCIEQIGGTIELQTRKDVGTTIRLTVPLTLAIVPAIMVFCGSHRFAIPQINVVEMLRLRGDEQQQACAQFHDTPVLRLRGELLPMADLCAKLGVESRFDRSTLTRSVSEGEGERSTAAPIPSLSERSPSLTLRVSEPLAERDALDIVVLKTGTRRYALLVDEIGDAQEIVVKPLGDLFTSRIEYSGAAMMGDGTIAMILDVLGIARSTGLLTSEQTLLDHSVTEQAAVPQLEEQVLICQVDGERQIAFGSVVCGLVV